MRSTIAIVVLLAAWLNPLASAGDNECTVSAKAVPLCMVLSDAANYDGKEIIVKGLYRMVIHGSILTSPACGKTYVNMRQAPDYKAGKLASSVMGSLTKKDQFQSVEVVLRGTFRVAHQGQCFGQNCLLYEIENHEILCAEAPKSNGSSGGTEPNGEGGNQQCTSEFDFVFQIGWLAHLYVFL